MADGRAGGIWRGKRAKGAARLCCAPLRFGGGYRLEKNFLPFGIGNAMQYVIGSFLNACVGPVELARRLGSQLTKHVSIAQSVNRLKNQIRPHG
jgi:hypothetical protein